MGSYASSPTNVFYPTTTTIGQKAQDISFDPSLSSNYYNQNQSALETYRGPTFLKINPTLRGRNRSLSVSNLSSNENVIQIQTLTRPWNQSVTNVYHIGHGGSDDLNFMEQYEARIN